MNSKQTGGTRTGKRYRCSACGELGHNAKTCTRANASRALNGAAAVYGRRTMASFEPALSSASARVRAAEARVAGAANDKAFDEAIKELEFAIGQYEVVGSCARRYSAAVQAFVPDAADDGRVDRGEGQRYAEIDKPMEEHADGMQTQVEGVPVGQVTEEAVQTVQAGQVQAAVQVAVDQVAAGQVGVGHAHAPAVQVEQVQVEQVQVEQVQVQVEAEPEEDRYFSKT